MGRRLNALIGRSFKPSKLRTHLNLAISRLSVLKNQRQTRCSQARSDVVQLLNLGSYQKALLRVAHVIKEQNRIDVFLMLEDYCILVMERLDLVEQNKECPEELKEAIASLIYAASRCGEFPELSQIRTVFSSIYGKEFVSRCEELRNNCGVNLQTIQKLSSKQPDLERRTEILNEIASTNGISLQIDVRKNEEPSNSVGTWRVEEKDRVVREYKDVAEAAQSAFESAAYAAAAARVAVELSRSDPRGSSDSGNEKFRHRTDDSYRDEREKELRDADEEHYKGLSEIYNSETDYARQQEQEIQEMEGSRDSVGDPKPLTSESSSKVVEDSRSASIFEGKSDGSSKNDDLDIAILDDYASQTVTGSNAKNASPRRRAPILYLEKKPMSVRNNRR